MYNERMFIHKPGSFKIPIKKFLIGIFLALFSAFILYSWMYVCREALRFISITEDFDIWIFSDKEVAFYNLMFAFLSLIFAQSVCFKLWFEKPRELFSRNNRLFVSVVNDQTGLNSYFINCFSNRVVKSKYY